MDRRARRQRSAPLARPPALEPRHARAGRRGTRGAAKSLAAPPKRPAERPTARRLTRSPPRRSILPPSPSPPPPRQARRFVLRVAAPARASARLARSARLSPKAGIVEDIKRSIDEYQEKAAKAKLVASPPGVPPPPVVPVLEPGKIGFVENAERWNSRASMVGWWSLLIVELVAGKGLLEIMGFTVGKGINFTF